MSEMGALLTIFFVFTGLLLELAYKPLACSVRELVLSSWGIASELNLLEIAGTSVVCALVGCALGDGCPDILWLCG